MHTWSQLTLTCWCALLAAMQPDGSMAVLSQAAMRGLAGTLWRSTRPFLAASPSWAKLLVERGFVDIGLLVHNAPSEGGGVREAGDEDGGPPVLRFEEYYEFVDRVANRLQHSRTSPDTAGMLASTSMRSIGRQSSAIDASLGGGSKGAGDGGLRSQSAGSLRHYGKGQQPQEQRSRRDSATSTSTTGQEQATIRRRPTTASGTAPTRSGSRSGNRSAGRRRGSAASRLRPATAPNRKVKLTPIVAEEWVTAMDPKNKNKSST